MLLFIDNSMSEGFKTLKSFLEKQPNIITLLQSGSTSETCFFKCFKNRSIQKQSKLSILYILSVSFSGAQRAQMNQRNKSSAHNGAVVVGALDQRPKIFQFSLGGEGGSCWWSSRESQGTASLLYTIIEWRKYFGKT